MPEGDAIFRFAVRLRADLVGRELRELYVHHRGRIDLSEGPGVTSIETRGKHTLIHLEKRAALPDRALHIHLGMNGGWRRVATDRPRRQERGQAGAVLRTAEWQWICYHPMRAEILEGEMIRSHRSMRRMGPDLLGDEVDWDEILRRIRDPKHARRTIADAVLDQSIAAGIGTIYRSESLFVAKQSPWVPVMAISDEQLLNIYQSARRLLSMNLVPGRQTRTVDPGKRRPVERRHDVSTYVYTRAGERCVECDSVVEVRRHSDDARKTYYCRQCQIIGPREARGG